jgi:hypothetical protein
VENSVPDGSNEDQVELKTYNYLDCCIYTVENLTEGQLGKEMLPLFATLIGNDFIEKKVFNHFLHNVRKNKYSKKLSPQQKRIFKIMDFLRNETLKSAIKKIMGHLKSYQRERVLNRIKFVMNGYCMEKSEAFDYFGLQDEFPEAEEIEGFNIDDLLRSSDEETEENAESGDLESDEEIESENQETAEESEEAGSDGSKLADLLDEKLNIDENEEVPESDNEENSQSEAEDQEKNSEYSEDPGSSGDDAEEKPEIKKFRKIPIPTWFEATYKSGTTPRFLCDILRYRRFINYPQVEEFDKADANQIALPITSLIFALLHNTDGSYFCYYSRVPKYIRYDVKKVERPELRTEFDPVEKKNVKFLKFLFEKNVKNCEELKIFEKIYEVPETHQLFILSVVYWLNNSTGADYCFLIAALLGLVTLSVVDKKCEKFHRDQGVFLKNYKKYLEEQKKGLNPEAVKIEKLEISLSKKLSSFQKDVTKSEALLAMEKLVSHFSVSPKMERKHADFRRNVVHIFSELQAVIFNLNALNPLLNFPFENVKIEKYFNGLFLYNVYNNLKSRSDPKEYIRTNVFVNSPKLWMYFSALLEFCEGILPPLKLNDVKEETVKKPKKVKQNKVTKKISEKVNDCVVEKDQESEDDGGYFDANNKFSCLIKNC